MRQWCDRLEGEAWNSPLPHPAPSVQDARDSDMECIYQLVHNHCPQISSGQKHAIIARASPTHIAKRLKLSRSTVKRKLKHLKRSWDMQEWQQKHPGGRRAGERGKDNGPTWWFLPHWKTVIDLRKADRTIGRDKLGRPWVYGRTKRYLSQWEIWARNIDAYIDAGAQAAPVVAPAGAEEWLEQEQAAWRPDRASAVPEPALEKPADDLPPSQPAWLRKVLHQMVLSHTQKEAAKLWDELAQIAPDLDEGKFSKWAEPTIGVPKQRRWFSQLRRIVLAAAHEARQAASGVDEEGTLENVLRVCGEQLARLRSGDHPRMRLVDKERVIRLITERQEEALQRLAHIRSMKRAPARAG